MQKKYTFDLRTVGGRIRKARVALEMTQEKIAEKTDFSAQYWSMMETGRYGGSVNTYLQIASALGLSLNDLFYDEADKIRLERRFSTEGFLADCNEFEKAVLLDFLFIMKATLQKRRDLHDNERT